MATGGKPPARGGAGKPGGGGAGGGGGGGFGGPPGGGGGGNAPRLGLWLGVAAIMLLADQFTKVLILGYYQLGDATVVTSFFNVVRVHNTGAAFSFLRDSAGWQRWLFTGIGLAAAVFILVMLKRHPGQKLFCFALSCILGGAIGNVVDRLVHGYVVDFLDFHWQAMHFPAFNIADSAITVGAACLILDELLRVRNAH